MIIEHPGASLLYRHATGLERAMADVDGYRLIDIYAEAVIDVWDPYKISLNQPALSRMGDGREPLGGRLARAHATGMDRPAMGIPIAARHARRIADGARFHRPRFRARPDRLSAARIHRPAARILRGAQDDRRAMERVDQAHARAAHQARRGRRRGDRRRVDRGRRLSGMMGAALDDGPALYGRRAVLRQRGVETALQLSRFQFVTSTREAIDYERVCIPG